MSKKNRLIEKLAEVLINENIIVLENHNPPTRFLSHSLLKLWVGLLLCLSHLSSLSAFSGSSVNSNVTAEVERILKKSNQKAYFEKNIGQWNGSFEGLAQASNMTARFYADKVSFILKSDDKQDVFVYNMQMLQVSEDVQLVFKNKKTGLKNYVGCVDEVELFEEVRYENIYPNIDLRFYVNEQGELEFDYIVLPGGDPNVIRYHLEGTESLKVLPEGTLTYCSPFGELTSSKPFSYQGETNGIEEIESKYEIADNEISFSIANYDKFSPLIIDPTVFEWSTYIGGNGNSLSFHDEFFHEGEFLYVCGLDSDIGGNYDYPTTPGSYPADPTFAGIVNMVVSKFDTLGNLHFSTYLPVTVSGTKDFDFAFDDNSVFFTLSFTDQAEFIPGISPTAFDQTKSSNATEVVAGRLNGDDGILSWSSYLGGSMNEIVSGISVADGIVAIAGLTSSNDFPLYQANVTTLSSSLDGFITKFDYDGNILYSSYIGAPKPFFERGSNAVITKNGYTGVTFFLEDGLTFPVTQNPSPPLINSVSSLVHVIYDSSNNVQYSTQYNNDGIRISDIDFDGDHLCILTQQAGDNGFVTPGAYQDDNINGLETTHLYCIDVPNASVAFATYNLNDSFIGEPGQVKVENGLVYVGGIATHQDEQRNEVYLQQFDLSGNLVYQNDYGFSADEFVGLEIYNGEALMYLNATPSGNVFFPTPDAAQINPINQNVAASYIMRTDVNGNYTYGTWISGNSLSTIYTSFLYNGSIYATGVSRSGFPTTVGAFQTVSTVTGLGSTGPIRRNNDFYVLKINDAECIDDLEPDNIINPELIEVCMNGTVPFIAGPLMDIIQDSLPHYLIDNVLTPADNNFVVNYQWQIRFVGSANWINISGATNPAYQPQPLADDAEFRRIVTLEYANCSHSDTSNVSLVDVNQFFAPNLPEDTVYYKCATSSIQLDVTAAGGTPPYNYQWTPTAGLSDPNSPTPMTNTPQSAIYNVEVTDSNGCLFIEQFTVRVYEADAGDEMISCIGTGVQIGVPHIAPGVQGFEYSWSPATGLSDTTIAQPISNPPGPITYTLSITGPDRCTVTDSILVEPVQTVADAGQDITFCFGGSVQIGEANDPDFDFVWSPSLYLDNNLLSNPTVDPDELPLDNPMTYYLTKIHRTTGCTDFDSIRVYVNTAEAGLDFCGPRFIGAADHSSGSATFQWTVISGDASSIIGQENIPMPFVAPNQPTLYELNVTWNGITCTDQVFVPNCGCLIPNAEATSDFNCEVGDTDYNTVVFGTNIDTSRYDYLWTPSAGIPDPTSPFIQNFSISLTSSTTYTLRATLKTNSSISCATSVLLFPAPPPFPFEHAVDTITCMGEGVNIGGPTIAGWTATWTPDNGTLDQTSIFNPVASPDELTVYFVTIEEISSECQIRDTAIVEVFDIIADAGPDASLCENSIVELGTPAIPGLVYSWEPSLGLTDNDQAQPIDTIFATTTYYLTVSDSANTCSVEDTLVYTVVNNPDANAGENIVICKGGLGAQIGTPAIPGNTYLWSPTTGLSDPTIAQPFANPGITTVYTLTVANNAEGCFSTDAITVNVSNGEAVDAGPNAIVCLNETFQIGTSPPESGYSYVWTPTTGLDNPNIPEPTATVTDTITYTVTVTSPTGCIVQDTVLLMPSVPIVDAGEDINTCPGLDVVLGTPGLPGYSYAWTPTTGLDNASLAQPTLTTSMNQVYTLTATDLNNCDATDQVAVTVETITVDAGPDEIICSSGVTIGTASQGSDFVYSWSPNVSLSNPNVAQPIATPTTETTYTATITQLSTGCTATDMVLVSPSAVADAGPDHIACSAESVIIGAPSIPGSSYSWSPSTGLSNPNIAQPTATITTSMTYTLTVTSGGCSSSDEILVEVNPDPAIMLNDFEALCAGACVQIGPMTSPLYRYSWSPALGLSDPTIANPIACPEMTTVYTLVVTDLISSCTTEEKVTVNVSNVPPPAPNASLDRTLCPGENTQIGAANQNSNYAYSWNPTTNLTAPFSPSTDVIIPGGAQGEFTYILTATNVESGCEGKDTVVIFINQNPIVPVIPDVTVCLNSTVQLCEGCMENSDYLYAWNPGNLVSDSAALSVTTTVDQTTNFELTITDKQTGCHSITTVTVDVNSLASPTADAGDDQILCLDEVITIGQSDDGDTYTWYPEESRPYLSDAFISDPTFTPLDTGRVTLWLEVENAEGCTSIDTIEIYVLEEASINAGSSFFTCVSQITLNASIDVGQGEWSLFSGPSTPFIGSPNNPTTDVASLIPGTYRFAWTVASTDVCNTDAFDLVTVEVLTEPDVEVRRDFMSCIDVPNFIGQDDEGLMYTWFPESLRPLLSDPFISNPTFTATEVGEYTLWLEAENAAGCTDVDTIVISILESVVIDAGPDLSTCDTEFALNGSSTLGNTLWITNTGPSTPLIHSPFDFSTEVSQVVPGIYEFIQVNISQSGICNAAESDTVFVTIYETPDADAGSDFVICDDETATLGPPTGDESYEWFPLNLRGSLSDPFIRNPVFSPVDTGSVQLWVEITNDEGCFDRDTIQIDVLGNVKISVVNPIVACQTEVNLIATIDGGEGEWTFVNGPTLPNIEDPSDPLTRVNNLVPGVYTMAWTIVSDNACNEGEFENITLEILDGPVANIDINCETTNGVASFTYTILVDGNGAAGTYDVDGFNTHTGLAYNQTHGPFGPFIIDNVDYELTISSDDSDCADIVEVILPFCETTDFGDLPDTAAGTGPGNYETYSFHNGPSHRQINGLKLANRFDTEAEAAPSADALGDGIDEDLYIFANGMDFIKGAIYIMPLDVENTTGETAFVEIWIDWNGDGDFMDADELVYDENGDNNGNFAAATWNLEAPASAVVNQLIGMRVRLSLQENMTPNGPINSGEVEDYLFRLVENEDICLPIIIQIEN